MDLIKGSCNVWDKWSKLERVVLGDTYDPEFFRTVKNKRIQSSLQWIAEETQEDLESYSNILKDFGCEVLRPDMDRNDHIMNHIGRNNQIQDVVPRPPLQPRDNFAVIGNKLITTGQDSQQLHNVLDPITDYDWRLLNKENVSGAGIFQCGTDLYVNNHGGPNGKSLLQGQELHDLREAWGHDKRIHTLRHDGHSDSSFHPISPNAILSLFEVQTYDETYPGWDVLYLPDQTWRHDSEFLRAKTLTKGKYWIPGQEDNKELSDYVDSWLRDWVGYAEETVFDVNVLMLDEHHCAVSGDNPEVFKFMRSKGIEPVPVPWRHRWFWDGGLHCLTLELNRAGKPVDHWPEGRDELYLHEYGKFRSISGATSPIDARNIRKDNEALKAIVKQNGP